VVYQTHGSTDESSWRAVGAIDLAPV